MFSDIGFFVAFLGGLISFFSPCILPIIPGYLSFLAGAAGDAKTNRWAIMRTTFFFVLGFSVIFTLLGVFLGVISRAFVNFTVWLNWIGGALIILFGLFTLKLINIPFLNREHRMSGPQTEKKGILSAFVAGAVFAIAWSPCVSAILASILVLAVTTGSEAQGALLLLSFSLGLGIPFLITGAFLEQARKIIRLSGRALSIVNIIAGILLVALGVLVFTNRLTLLINLFI